MHRTLFIAMLAASQALAFEVRTDSQGDVVRWERQVEFVISPDLADELELPGAQGAVKAAVATLAAKTAGLQVKVRVGQRPAQLGYAVGAANQNDIVLLEDWPYESSNLAATLVTLNARTNVVLDADIALNGESAGFLIVDDDGQGSQKLTTRYDLQNTVTHELGHALGLMHTDDPSSVMYPSAAPGEICKRTLGADDVAGLSWLYGAVEVAEDPIAPAVGCSSMPAPASLGVLAALLLLSRLRRRRLALLLVGASAALAAEPVTSVEPDEIAWGEVVEARSRWLTDGKVIVTDVEVEVQRCVKGACREQRVKVQVLGGRVGDLEQVVTHQPELKRGSQVVLTRRGGHLRMTIAR